MSKTTKRNSSITELVKYKKIYSSLISALGIASIISCAPWPLGEPTDWVFLGVNPLSRSEIISEIALMPGPAERIVVGYGETDTNANIVVKSFSSSTSSWTNKPDVGVRSLLLDFGYMGEIAIAVADIDDNNKVSVYKYNNQTDQWNRIGQKGISPGRVLKLELVQHSSVTTHHAVFFNSLMEGQGGVAQPYVFTYRQSGAWVNASSELSQQPTGIDWYRFSGSIGSHRAHIAFVDRQGLKMLSAYFPNQTISEWDIEHITRGLREYKISMHGDYVAYSDESKGGKIVVRKYSGSRTSSGDWELLGTEGFSPGRASHIAITLGIDKSGNGSFHPTQPYVVFSDETRGGRSTVMKWNGAQWVTIGTPGFSAGPAQNHAIRFLNNSQKIVVAYKDLGYGGKLIVKQHDNQ